MDTVIIYCNPNDLEKQDRIITTLVDDLSNTGFESVVYNMIGDVFSPHLLDSEQVELPDDQVVLNVIDNIQQDIVACNHILFVFTHYWDGLTIYTRRFVDKVFLSEWGGGNIFASDKKLKDKKATIVTTLKIPQILFSSRHGTGFSDPFAMSILKLCGIKNIKWFNITSWTAGNNKLKDKKLEKLREYFATLQLSQNW
jgi:putative NADPH-quinone reductase